MTFCLWRCLKQLFKYLGIPFLNTSVLSHVWWHQSSIYAGLDLFFSGGPPIWESHVGNRISAGLCGMFLQRVQQCLFLSKKWNQNCRTGAAEEESLESTQQWQWTKVFCFFWPRPVHLFKTRVSTRAFIRHQTPPHSAPDMYIFSSVL